MESSQIRSKRDENYDTDSTMKHRNGLHVLCRWLQTARSAAKRRILKGDDCDPHRDIGVNSSHHDR